MIRKAAYFLLVLMAIALMVESAVAQGPAIGTPPFGSFGGGPFDTVNLGNLNVHFAIPVLQKAGRGIPFVYNLSYDSSVWYPGTVNGVPKWLPTQTGYWGWQGLSTQAAFGNLTYTITTASGNCGQSGQYTWQSWTFNNIVYTDNNGSHSISYNPAWIYAANGQNVNNCPSNGAQPPTQAVIPFGDGTGRTFYGLVTGSSSLSWNVTTPSGTSFYNSGSGVSQTDANGNQITVNSSGSITDTLGQTALTVSGLAPNNTTLTYIPPSSESTMTASAVYTVSYKSYEVKTNFGCSSGDYDVNQSLVDKITLPDNSYYQFSYEATAGGTSGQVTGRLASVTLPTGGSITYTYPTYTANGHTYNSINCNDGSVAAAAGGTPSLTRVVSPGGTWTYSRAQVTGNQWTTTVTDPTTAANQTAITFQENSFNGSNPPFFYETERQAYSGSVGGTVLSTSYTCYNTASPTPTTCPTTAVYSPISRVTTFSYLPDSSGARSETDTQYSYVSDPSFPTEVDSYDFAKGNVGALLRKVISSYSAYGNTIRPTSVQVQDGSGTVFASTAYSYDQTALQTPGGTTPQWINAGSARGNLTTIQEEVTGGSTPTYLYKVLSYYNTGTPYQTSDWGPTSTGGSNPTTFNYSTVTQGNSTQSCGNSFVTSITEPLNLSQSSTWDCIGGVMTSSTNENGATANMFYTGTTCVQNGASADPAFWRPFATEDPLGNCTTFIYPSANAAESTLAFNSNHSVVDERITVDGFGRLLLNQAEQGYNSANYDTTFTQYNNLGSLYFTTLPYSGTAGQTNWSAPSVNNQYDALGRVQSTAYVPGGGSIGYAYKYNDTYQDVGPAPAPENDKRKQLEYDGLGRLTSVCEVTSAGPAVCGQSNNTYTGYWTQYTYDPLGDMTGVNENSQGAAGTNQTRAFAFDMLGRMTQEVNPESGTTNYIYDTTDSNCPSYSSYGDLVEKKDWVGNYTCLQYDNLHRVAQITYPSGVYATRTPTKCTVYGSPSVNGHTMTNANLQPGETFTTAASSCTGSPTKIVDEGFSYSARGELTDVYESTPHSGGYYHTTAAYWANGALETLSGVGQQSAYSYGVDGEGRPSTATQGSTNYVTGTTYNNASQPLTVSLKTSGDSDSYAYDANTGMMTNFTFTVNSKSMAGQLHWNTNLSLGSLAITDGFNSSGTETCNYGNSTTAGYDDLGRLLNMNCGTPWSQTFSYNDPFGNITKSGSSSWMPGYKNSNQYSLAGTLYDNNGNLTNDTFHTYTWDSDGNTATIDSTTCGTNGTCLTFDAADRIVEKNVAGVITEIEYSPIGKVAVMSGGTQKQAYVPLPGGETLSPGPDTYWHADWLGTVRLATGVSARTVTFDRAFAPFGEMYNTVTGGTSNPDYTGDTQGTVPGEFDTPFRELHPGQGRWISPDPAGLAAVDPTNPQTWNRYAYVGNMPLTLFDPLGLAGLCDDPTVIHCVTVYSCPWGQIRVGGMCVDFGPILTGYINCTLIQMFGGSIGGVACAALPASSGSSGSSGNNGSNNGTAKGPVVPKNPCLYQGRALSPSDYATQGKADNGHLGNLLLNSVTGFPAGHFFDPQPLATGDTFQRQAYGNYTFGVYMAAAGVPLRAALTGAAAYAGLFSSYPYHPQMDPEFPSLPIANVANIVNGYNAYKNGTVCHN